MDTRKILGLIPAKGASKRLPLKNIRALAGKPLLGWSVESALLAEAFENVVVSSECDEVLSIASQWDVETRKRPQKLAADPAGCIDVAKHVLMDLEMEGHNYTHVAILMPTCPFRGVEDILSAVSEIDHYDRGVVVSVSKFSHTPFNGFLIGSTGDLSPLIQDRFGRKTQELPDVYRPNGAIFIMARDTLLSSDNLYPDPMRPLVMPPHRSVDIDNELDFQWAEFLLDSGIII